MSDTASGTHERAVVTTSGNEMVITRTFIAPAALVYEAMTNPEHVRQCGEGGAERVVVHDPQPVG
jgi:uncharacterized protein YndB with AHSA1/START domain